MLGASGGVPILVYTFTLLHISPLHIPPRPAPFPINEQRCQRHNSQRDGYGVARRAEIMRELMAVEKTMAIVGLGDQREAQQSCREGKGFTGHFAIVLRNDKIL